jgi:hypothetical protein
MAKIRLNIIKIDFLFVLSIYHFLIESRTMSELGTSPRPPGFYRRMSTHGNMPVHIHNVAACKFNTFYKQPLSLGTIPETPENTYLTVTDAARAQKQH